MKQVEEEKASFFKRWSDRKLEASQAPVEEKPLAESTTEPKVEKTDADMPPLESLTAESDFSDFMSPGVSESLRKAALRKLFHMPHLNVVDGLDDYAEDFTSFEPLGDIVTHHARHMMEVEEKRRQEELREQQQQQQVAEDPVNKAENQPPLAVAEADTETAEQLNQETNESVSEQHEYS